jgi:hypothetical protein
MQGIGLELAHRLEPARELRERIDRIDFAQRVAAVVASDVGDGYASWWLR